MKLLAIFGLFILAALAHCQATVGWASEFSATPYGGVVESAQLDSQGNLYVVGFQRSPGSTPAASALAMKYDRNGILQWVDLLDGLVQVTDASGSCLDSSNNLFICGRIATDSHGYDALLVKIDTDGNLVWRAQLDGPTLSDDIFNAVTIDDQGSLYATGTTPFGPNVDFLVAKFSPQGQLQWSNTYDDQYHFNDEGDEIRVDSAHNVFIGGPCANFGIGNIVKFNSAGVFQWWNWAGVSTPPFGGIELGPNNTTYFVTTDNQGAIPSLTAARIESNGSTEDFATKIYTNDALNRVTGTAVDPSGRLVIGMFGNKCRAIKLDLNGAIVWDFTDPTLLTLLSVTTEGNVTYLVGTFQAVSGHVGTQVDKISDTGALLWRQYYPLDPGQDYTPRQVHSQNGLIAVISNEANSLIASTMFFEIPVAKNDQYKTNTGQTLTVAAASGVMANDSLALGAHAVQVSAPINGTLTLNGDGSLNYVPNAGFVGNDSFTYKDVHSLSQSNIATVTITVQPSLTGVSLNPTEVMGGDPTTGTVILSAAAPAGGVTINLSASSAVIQVPATVTVPAGQLSKTFTATTSYVDGNYTRYVIATCNGVTKTAALKLDKTIALANLTVSPNVIAGGQNTTGTVTLTSAAPSGGISVALSDNTTILSEPASVTVAAGVTTATFTITSAAVSSVVTRTVNATYKSVTKSANVTLQPVYALTALTLNPTTVVGGQISTGTVTLAGPAPVGGETVTLKSGSSVISVPPSVTVPAGATTATFTATTLHVAATVTRQISATFGTVTKVANLTITP